MSGQQRAMQAEALHTHDARGQKKCPWQKSKTEREVAKTYDTATAPSEQTVETWPTVWHRATAESALTPSWGTMGRLRSLIAHSATQYTTPKAS